MKPQLRLNIQKIRNHLTLFQQTILRCIVCFCFCVLPFETIAKAIVFNHSAAMDNLLDGALKKSFASPVSKTALLLAKLFGRPAQLRLASSSASAAFIPFDKSTTHLIVRVINEIQAVEFGLCFALGDHPSGSRLYSIDIATGSGQLIGATGFSGLSGLAISSHGEMFTFEKNTGKLYRIDAQTGEAFFVADVGVAGLECMAFDKEDNLYAIAADAPNFSLYKINTTTGRSALVGPTGHRFTGLTCDPIDGQLWAAVSGSNPSDADGIFTVDAASGAASLIGRTGLGGATPALHFDLNGKLYALKGQGVNTIPTLITVDKTTAKGVIIGTTGIASLTAMAFRTGTPRGSFLSVSPGSLDFGRILVNTTSAPKTLTIRSAGTDALVISEIRSTNDEIQLSRVPSLPHTLANDDTFSFEVTFAPIAAGTLVDTLKIISNDINTSVKKLVLRGQAKNPAPPEAALFLLDGNSQSILDLDPVLATTKRTYSLSGAADLERVGFAFDGNSLYVVNAVNLNKIYKLDGFNGSVQDSIFVNAIGRFDGLAFSGKSLFVSDFEQNRIYEIDPNSGIVRNRLTLPFKFITALTFAGSRISLFAVENGHTIYELDPFTGEVINSFAGPGQNIVGLAFSEAMKVLFATVADGTIYLLAPNSGAVTDVMSVQSNPAALAADEFTSFSGAVVYVRPGFLDFGSLFAGEVSPPQTLTVKNIGSQNLAISAVSEPGVPFVADSLPPVPLVLPPDSSYLFHLTFAPADTGDFRSLLQIFSNDAAKPIKSIELFGHAKPVSAADFGVFYASTGKRGSVPGSLLTINPATGYGTIVGATGLDGVPGLAINSRGEIFGTERVSGDLYRIDAATGKAIFVAETGLGFLDAIAFDSNNVLYGVNSNFNLYTIDTRSGETQFIGYTGDLFAGLAFDPFDGALWGSTAGFRPRVEDGIFTIDKQTGAAVLVGVTGLGGATPDLVFNAEGNLFGVKGGGKSQNELIAIDQFTGKGLIVGRIGFASVSGLAMRPAVLAGAQLALSPPKIDYGEILVNSATLTRTVSLRSIGTEDISISQIVSQDSSARILQMPALPLVLKPKSTASFEIIFKTKKLGSAKSLVNVVSTDFDDPIKALTLEGMGMLPPPPATLFAATARSDTLIAMDLPQGSVTVVGATLGYGEVNGMSFRKDGVLVGTTNGHSGNLIDLNIYTGTPTLIKKVAQGIIFGMDFHPSGRLFGVFQPDSSEFTRLVEIDLKTGGMSVVGSTGFGVVADLAFSADGRLFGVVPEANSSDLIAIDVQSGAGSVIGPMNFTDVRALSFGPDGKLYGGLGRTDARAGGIVTIDTVTGEGEFVLATGFAGLSGLAFFPATVNQPPFANAGADVTVELTAGQKTAEVVLNGSRSFDRDGAISWFEWRGDPDPPDVVNPPVTLAPGEYLFTLVVVDDQGLSSLPDSVAVHVDFAVPVELGRFDATVQENTVMLTWEVAFSSRHAGFNLWRSHSRHERGKKLNEKPLLGEKVFSFKDANLNSGFEYIYTLEIIYESGMSETLGQISARVAAPEHFQLAQNYPNPFNPETRIKYQLPVNSQISIWVFDIKGQMVRKLIDQKMKAAGFYSITWDGRNDAGKAVSSGVYFYSLIARASRDLSHTFRQSKKMTLLK